MSKQPGEMFEEDSVHSDAPLDENKLGIVAKLANELVETQDQVADLEERLKVLNDRLRQITELNLPDIFKEMGLTELRLKSGQKLILSTFYNAKIPEGNEGSAFKWLEDHGEDAIIKSKVDMTFGKGKKEREQERQVINALKDLGVLFNNKRGVHPMTLKAFVKEKIESGANLPLDLFGVYIGSRVTIK